MTIRRYNVCFTGDKTAIISSLPCNASSEEAAHDGLHRFLDLCRAEYGDQLRWVSLEFSDSAEQYFDSAGWEQVERIGA